jgi:hypothetical protein
MSFPATRHPEMERAFHSDSPNLHVSVIRVRG